MNDPTSAALGGLLAKLLPAGIGAALMVAVDPPQSRRELFARVFVAMACSYLFSKFAFDFAHSFSLFSFLDWTSDEHRIAVEGVVGAAGWFVIGGVSQILKRFRADPLQTAEDAKKVIQ